MSIKTARKLGFFSALTMLLGTVVGIGIFFKNGSVLGAANDNGPTALTGWIIGGILALFAAISFSELGSQKTKLISGLPAWSRRIGGKKYGNFIKINYTIFYLGFLTPIMGFFVSELFFFFLQTATNGSVKVPSVLINAMVGLSFTLFSLFINITSISTSKHIQHLTTLTKFIPIILAIIIGVVLPNTHNDGGKSYFANNTDFTFVGLLAGLPAILFAYDAFLIVGQITNKTKNGSKTISKVVLVGLISITILYSLLSVSAMFHGGSINKIISDSLPASAAEGVNIFVFLVLFISGYGVLNGISLAVVSSLEQLVNTNSVYGFSKISKMYGKRKAHIALVSLVTIFGFIIMILPAIIIDSDQYVDAVSNFPTLFFFAIYAITILLYIRKRNDMKTTKINSKLFYAASITFVVGTLFVVAYQVLYGFTVKLFLDPNIAYKGIGLFAPSNHDVTNIEFFGIFVSMLLLFFILPLGNYLLIKYKEKRDPLIEEDNISNNNEVNA